MFGFVLGLGFVSVAVFALASLRHSFAGMAGVVRGLRAELANAQLTTCYTIRSEDIIIGRALPARRPVQATRPARRPTVTPLPDRRRAAA